MTRVSSVELDTQHGTRKHERTATRRPSDGENGAPVNISPGIAAMYGLLAWTLLAIPAGVLVGRALRAARTLATGRCCGMCDQ